MITAYTDGSVSQKHRLGIGGFLIPPNDIVYIVNQNIKESVKMELLTIISCLEHIKTLDNEKQNEGRNNVSLYTDSESCYNLLYKRRKKLEDSDFQTKKGVHRYKDLYKVFFRLADATNVKINWIKGHKKKELKTTEEDKLFSFLDKAVRKKLRERLSKANV